MKIINWIKTWGVLIIALFALVISILAVRLDSIHFNESKKLQEQRYEELNNQYIETRELAQTASEHQQIYDRLNVLDRKIQNAREWIDSWMRLDEDTTDFVDCLREAERLSDEANEAWNNRNSGEADRLIKEAYDFLAEIPLPPAAFTTGAFSISPTEVNVGESVTISLRVTNTGDLSGSYEVTIKIDNVVVETKIVTLAGGASQTITFTTAQDVAGTYAVDVNGLSGTFMVKTVPAGITWWVWLIVGMVVVIVGWLVYFLWWRPQGED